MSPSIHHLFLPAVVTGAGGVVGVDGRETGGGWGEEVLCDSTAQLGTMSYTCTLARHFLFVSCILLCVMLLNVM